MIRNKQVANNAEIALHKIAGGGGFPLKYGGKTVYVDADNGNDGYNGLTVDSAFKTIQAAVTAAGAFSRVYVFPKAMAVGETDPGSYAETIIIPETHECLQLLGVPYGGQTQGGLPQIKKGAGTTAILDVKAAGCYIANLGINGVSSSGGGIVIRNFGTTVENCHIKNCIGGTVTDGTTGPGIKLLGCPWQVLIRGNRFWKNVGDVVAEAITVDAQDIVIENNIFGGPLATVDVNIHMVGSGDSATGLVIRDNYFTALPTLTSGAHARFVVLTGYTGLLAGNYFATLVDPQLTELTFASAGTAAIVPATVFMAGNFGEVKSTGNTENNATIGRYA